MNRTTIFLLTITLSLTCYQVFGQNYEEHDVDKFYKKIELENETLDETGQSIDFIFVKTELEAGKYEIEIADGPGDLYEIKGTDMYVKFRGYYGYAGYGEEGILVVGTSAFLSTFYKKED